MRRRLIWCKHAPEHRQPQILKIKLGSQVAPILVRLTGLSGQKISAAAGEVLGRAWAVYPSRPGGTHCLATLECAFLDLLRNCPTDIGQTP
jgi:hypothetical protein